MHTLLIVATLFVGLPEDWDTTFRVFGGKDGKLFLGCLTCDEGRDDSVFNHFGDFGKCPDTYGVKSLYCRSWFTVDINPCAVDAREPPSIYDDQGNYYGRLSVGGLHGHPDSVCLTSSLYQTADACRLIQDICRTDLIFRRNYPVDPPRFLYLGRCRAGQTIKGIHDGAKIIELDDDSRWLVNERSREAVLGRWFLGDEVLLCRGDRMADPKRLSTIVVSRLSY